MQITDLCDAFREKISVADPIFNSYGGKRFFYGTINTVKIFEDNSLVREMLSTPVENGILIIDGGGSQRCALLGDQLAQLGIDNGWNGVIVYGCVRDTSVLCGLDFGVKAINAHPLKSLKKGQGERNIPVKFAGVTFNPGQYLYADDDGVIVSDSNLANT